MENWLNHHHERIFLNKKIPTIKNIKFGSHTDINGSRVPLYPNDRPVVMNA